MEKYFYLIALLMVFACFGVLVPYLKRERILHKRKGVNYYNYEEYKQYFNLGVKPWPLVFAGMYLLALIALSLYVLSINILFFYIIPFGVLFVTVLFATLLYLMERRYIKVAKSTVTNSTPKGMI